jgi:hypothetical protein
MDLGFWILVFKQNLFNTKQCFGNNYRIQICGER